MIFTRKNLLTGPQGLLIRFMVWGLVEVLLNYAGIDDLADYSEFLFDRPVAVMSQSHLLNR